MELLGTGNAERAQPLLQMFPVATSGTAAKKKPRGSDSIFAHRPTSVCDRTPPAVNKVHSDSYHKFLIHGGFIFVKRDSSREKG